jgi:4-amino-4-deoxy-L-arabinose transferase-like glycosyltransferase
MPYASRQALLLLAVAVYCLLVLPRMLSYGMFLDGITYASIARNMADHYGSFWQPYYTATAYPVFYEQPPLGFWLQSWAYRLFGDSVYIEAWWGFLTGALILVGLRSIWRCNTPRDYALAGAWFPILLFVIIPMTSWILSNNMLENTMTVFIMASVCSCLLSLKSPKKSLSLLYGLLAGFNTFLAFLIKGPVALFTLVVPLLSTIVMEERYSKVILINFYIVFAFSASMAIMLLMSHESLYFLTQYFQSQVIASLYGERGRVSSRFNVLYFIGRDIAVPLVFGGLLQVFVNKLGKATTWPINHRLLLYYLCIALVGSVPIFISPQQRRWYVFPSFPFYALAIATLFNNMALTLERMISQNKNMYRHTLNISVIVIGSSILLMFLGKQYLGRDKDFHNDFSIQPLTIEEREILSVYPESMEFKWDLVANMQRQFKASLVKHPGHKYLLSTVENKHSEHIPSTYQFLHPEKPKKYLVFKLAE